MIEHQMQMMYNIASLSSWLEPVTCTDGRKGKEKERLAGQEGDLVSRVSAAIKL